MLNFNDFLVHPLCQQLLNVGTGLSWIYVEFATEGLNEGSWDGSLIRYDVRERCLVSDIK